MSELYPKRFLKCLGPLFQEHRKKSGYSVRDIARSANISHTIVFDIENRNIIPNPETLEDLFDTLGVPLYKDSETLWPLKDTLDAFFEVFYTKQEREMALYYQSLLRGEKILMHSPLRIEFLFAKALNAMVLEKKTASAIIESLEPLHDCFTDHQKQALVLVKGINAYVSKNYNLAFRYFIRAEEIIASANMNRVTYYYLAFTADKLFKKELSLYYARTASDRFSEANNFKRKLELDLLLAKNMIELGNLQTAKDYLNSIRYAISNSDGENDDKQWLMNLWGYLYHVKCDYQKSDEQIETGDENNIGAVLLNAFNAYYQKRYEDTKKHINDLVAFKGDAFTIYRKCALIVMDHLGEKKSPSELESAMDYVLDHTFDLETIHARTFFTNLIIQYHENNGNYERALDVAKKLIDQYTAIGNDETV